jgi:hypothetical protein
MRFQRRSRHLVRRLSDAVIARGMARRIGIDVDYWDEAGWRAILILPTGRLSPSWAPNSTAIAWPMLCYGAARFGARTAEPQRNTPGVDAVRLQTNRGGKLSPNMSLPPDTNPRIPAPTHCQTQEYLCLATEPLPNFPAVSGA